MTNTPRNPKKSSEGKESTRKQEKAYDDYYKYSAITVKMIAIILGGVYGGRKLDEYLQLETPWMTLLFSLLSVALALYVVIRDITR